MTSIWMLKPSWNISVLASQTRDPTSSGSHSARKVVSIRASKTPAYGQDRLEYPTGMGELGPSALATVDTNRHWELTRLPGRRLKIPRIMPSRAQTSRCRNSA